MQLVEEKKNNEEHKFLASRGELNISLNLPWYVSGKICFFWVFDQRGQQNFRFYSRIMYDHSCLCTGYDL